MLWLFICSGLFFDGYSGWMIFNLPKVEQGIIMIKLHTWTFFPPPPTEGWCSENNESPCSSRALAADSASVNTTDAQQQEQQRMLKPKVPEFCKDFKFEFAIDGKITSWDQTQFEEHKRKPQRVVEFFTLLDDDNWDGTKDVEVAIRTTGCGRSKPLDITHMYWI